MTRISKNRKAQGFSPVKTLILCLVAGILLIAIGYKMVTSSNAVSQLEKCRLSILAADKLAAAKASDVFSINFECPPHEIVVKKSDVVAGGSVQKDKITNIFSQEMYSCYRKTGAGKLDPFRKVWGTVDETFCLICSKISFDKKVADLAAQDGTRVTGLPYSLYSKKIPGQKVSFYQVTHGGSAPPSAELDALKAAENAPSTAISLTDDYAVVWRFEKFEPGALFYIGATAAIVGGTTLAVLATVGTGGVALAVVGSVAVAGLGTEIATAGSFGTHAAGRQSAGNAIGFLTQREKGTIDLVDQQVWVVPEEKLSGKYPGTDKDFCTQIVN